MANIKIIRDANGNYSKKGGTSFGTTKPFIQNKTSPNEPGLDMDSVHTAPHRIKNRITNKIVDGTKYVKKEVFKYNKTTGKPKSVTTTYYKPDNGFYPHENAGNYATTFGGDTTGTIKRIVEVHTDSYALVCAELTTSVSWKHPVQIRTFAGYRGRNTTTDTTTVTGGTVDDFNSVLIQRNAGMP